MPGHILKAVCGCGYENEVSPGYNEMLKEEVAISYNTDFSSVDTVPVTQIEKDKLRFIVDPFIMTAEEDRFLSSTDFQTASEAEKLLARKILMKTQEGLSNAYLCPRCKNNSMFFHFVGHWD
jgi:hypothetical protein